MSERRDKEELLGLASMYLSVKRCIGGHVVHEGYVCPWCASVQPTGSGGWCEKEKVRGPNTDSNDCPMSWTVKGA